MRAAPTIAGSGLFAGLRFAPLVPALFSSPFLVRDFTAGLEGLPSLAEAGYAHDVGRYNERRRSMYTTDLFDVDPQGGTSAVSSRDIHVGYATRVRLRTHAVAAKLPRSIRCWQRRRGRRRWYCGALGGRLRGALCRLQPCAPRLRTCDRDGARTQRPPSLGALRAPQRRVHCQSDGRRRGSERRDPRLAWRQARERRLAVRLWTDHQRCRRPSARQQRASATSAPMELRQ
jgi:hypothetical protein